MKTPNKASLILFFLILAFSAEAQWVRSAKSRAFSRSNGVDTDNSGNVYSAGVFSCIVAFESDSLLNNSCGEVTPPAPATPQTDGYLAKHDENGNLLWVLQFPGSAGNRLFVNGVSVDPSGNCYVAGAFTGTLDLIASQFSNPDATTEFFVVKVQPDGTAEWAISYACDNQSESFAQKISATHNAVFVTGYVRGEFDLGGLADSVGNNASFIASFDLSGNPLWAKNLMEVNANGSSRGKAMEARGDSIWVFSSFTDTVRVEGNLVTPPGPVATINAGIICLYDEAGTLLNQMVTNTPLIEGIRLHRPDASLYITGRAEDITAIGGDTLFDVAGDRAYVSSHSLDMSAANTLQWLVPITAATPAGLTGTDVDVSAQGNIFVAGTFNATTIMAPATSAPGGGALNGFIIKVDAAGTDLWLQSFGGVGDDAVSGLSAPDDMRIFGAGYFGRYMRVAGDEITISAGSNGFVARIDVCPELIADMITPDSSFVCKRDTTLFQVTNNAAYTYQWFKDGAMVAGAIDADLEVTQEGTYRAEITASGCAKMTPLAKLFLNPLPDSVVLTNDPLENCAGATVDLAGPIGSYTFQWLNNGVAMPDITKDIAVTADGDYSLEITDALGCSILSDTFAIRFHDYPLNTLTPPGGRYTLCSGNSFLIQADNPLPDFTFQWKKDDLPIANADDSEYSVTESGIYQAVIRNSIGCETTTEADTVVVQASPLVDLNDESVPPEICDGGSIRLVTPQVIGQTYQWLRDGVVIPAATGNILDVFTSGQYAVRVNNTLCEKFSSTFSLSVKPLPTAVITNNAPAAICDGDEYELLAQQGTNYSYQWLDNTQTLAGEQQSSLEITKTGNYSLRITNEFNCQATSPVTSVVVNLKPPASITAGGATVFCEGGSVALNANAGTSLAYQWLRNDLDLAGATQSTLNVAANGTFRLRVTNINLCAEISGPVTVEVVPYPQATIASATGLNTICERDSVQLQAGASMSYDYRWMYNGRVIEQAVSPVFYAKNPGDYRVIASTGSCRDTSAVVSLQVRSNPVPLVTRNEDFLSIALFGDIQWYRNDEAIAAGNLQAIRVTDDGNYEVNVVNAEGCSAWSETVSICVPIPEIRKTNDVLVVSIAASKYDWEYGQIPISGAGLRQLTAQQSGDYSVVVVSDDGCTMETKPVTVCIPYPYITRDELTGVLYAFPNPAASYQWLFEGMPVPDGMTQVHIPDQPGNYSVEVRDLEGCVSSSELFTITPITGLEVDLANHVRVFPNPVRNILSIENTNSGEVLLLVIVDSTGRIVKEDKVSGDRHQVELSDLGAGVYILMLETSTRKTAWKLVKN